MFDFQSGDEISLRTCDTVDRPNKANGVPRLCDATLNVISLKRRNIKLSTTTMTQKKKKKNLIVYLETNGTVTDL